jgi:hypothetical protein
MPGTAVGGYRIELPAPDTSDLPPSLPELPPVVPTDPVPVPVPTTPEPPTTAPISPPSPPVNAAPPGASPGGSSGGGSGGNLPAPSALAPPRGGSQGSGGGARTGAGTRGESLGRAQRRTYERRLRSVVRRFRGCLRTLPSLHARVLGLRAGLHGRAMSRGSVARRLHISVGQAARAERRGLRSLRGGCSGARGSAGAADSGVVQKYAGNAVRSILGTAARGLPDSVRVAGVGRSSENGDGEAGAVSAPSGPSAVSAGPSPAAGSGGEAESLRWAAVFATVALCAAAALFMSARRRTSAAAVDRAALTALPPPVVPEQGREHEVGGAPKRVQSGRRRWDWQEVSAMVAALEDAAGEPERSNRPTNGPTPASDPQDDPDTS